MSLSCVVTNYTGIGKQFFHLLFNISLWAEWIPWNVQSFQLTAASQTGQVIHTGNFCIRKKALCQISFIYIGYKVTFLLYTVQFWTQYKNQLHVLYHSFSSPSFYSHSVWVIPCRDVIHVTAVLRTWDLGKVPGQAPTYDSKQVGTGQSDKHPKSDKLLSWNGPIRIRDASGVYIFGNSRWDPYGLMGLTPCGPVTCVTVVLRTRDLG